MTAPHAPLGQARSTLSLLGYGEELVEENYPIWTGAGNSRVDLAAFARRNPKDMSTAAIVVQQSSREASGRIQDETSSLALTLAAPFIAVALPESLRIASVNIDGTSETLTEIDYHDHSQASRIAHRLDPRSVLEAKTGSRQPALFPMDVSILERARKDSGDRLSPRVEEALRGAFDVLGYQSSKPSSEEATERLHKRAARLVVGALTTLVLRDKEGLPKGTAGVTVDSVMQHHPQEFRWVTSLDSRELDALTGIVAGLGRDIDFRGLDPSILSEVYEKTLVSDAQRRKLGTHYTPPALARKMLAATPMETVSPEERLVIDPTCGSGGLLLAAHDRLRALQPTDWDLRESHRDLTAHLHGYDTDAFAVEIARLSLFLHAVPAGNGWDVKHGDALNVKLKGNARPSIIVANPPWKNTNTGGRRSERADDFLLWMLNSLRPGGLLSIVLPIGWLSNRSSRETRNKVRALCDIFEIWRLPKGSFNSANAAPAVLTARRHEKAAGSQGPILFRRVINRGSLESFYKSGRASEVFLTDSLTSSPGDVSLITGPLTDWANGQDFSTLGDVADVVTGPQPKSGILGRTDGTENCQYLKLSGSLHPFAEADPEDLMSVHFPDDFQTGRGSAGLGKPKVLTPAASGPDTPWRLKPSIDTRGILVRNSLHMVMPKSDEDDLLYGLLAFLGTGFASCWIDERALERNVSTADARSIPIPRDPLVWRRFAELGRELHRMSHRLDQASPLLRDLEEAAWECMGVPDNLRNKLIARLNSVWAPEGSHRYSRAASAQMPAQLDMNSSGKLRDRYGSVLSVTNGEILVEVPGITSMEGEWIEPPNGMPGSICRSGETFDVMIRDSAPLSFGQFRHQSASWMSSEDLQEAVHNVDDEPTWLQP
ncbi:class I SAM-dependent DNA methyltransferase [Streptomyces sp. NPDC059209]|uniref:HsdM family class I SAM-dependent methyltransferase n=1 Tax=Streptomyces sp. NPDC059209 TaxID=3346769 RepID=UPI00368823E0